MTDSYPPSRNAVGSVHPDMDTTALPRIPEDQPSWAPPPASNGQQRSENGFEAPPSSTGPMSFGSKLTAAGASAVAAATSAAASAKEAVRGGSSAPASGAAVGAAAAGTANGAAAKKATTGRSGRSTRVPRSTSRQPRKARLTLSHVNVYSIFKFSCVLSIALFFTWLIMIGVLYGILDVAGVLKQVNDAVNRISGTDNPKDVVTGSIVFGGAIIIGAVYIVLFIAMSTIGSMIYNLCADLVGGVEVTLSERE
ncbi:DUF3566 domain-containing protein [Jatrophihabitans sp. DSM 45814]